MCVFLLKLMCVYICEGVSVASLSTSSLFICSASPLPGAWPQGKHQSSGLTEEALTGSTGGLNRFHRSTGSSSPLLCLTSLASSFHHFSCHFPILTPSLKDPLTFRLALISPLSSLEDHRDIYTSEEIHCFYISP